MLRWGARDGIFCYGWQARDRARCRRSTPACLETGNRLGAEDVSTAEADISEIAGIYECPMLLNMDSTRAVTREAKSVFTIPCTVYRIALLGSSAVDRVIANYAIERQSSLPCPPDSSFPGPRPCAGFA